MGKMLHVQDLNVHYGSIHAIHGISLDVDEGEVVSLIGANGAGKTTILHTITGIKKATSGSVELCGTNLLTTEPHKIVGLGMAHVPEGRHVFTQMTVEENLEMGAFTAKDKSHIQEDLQNVYRRFPRLEERRGQLAGTLSGGEQQMLAVGRALMSKPRLLMLDEPSLGLAPIVVREIFDIIRTVNQQGITVLLNEQNANMALKVADYAYVLETGNLTLSGTGAELLANEQVKAAYLGRKRTE